MSSAADRIRAELQAQGKDLSPEALREKEGVGFKEVNGQRLPTQSTQLVRLLTDDILELAAPRKGSDQVAADLHLGSTNAGPGVHVLVQVRDVLHVLGLGGGE